MGLVASAMMGAWKTVGVKKGKAPRDENRGKLLALAELLYFANKRTMFYRGAYTRLLWSLGHVGYSGLLRAFWSASGILWVFWSTSGILGSLVY